MLIDLVFSQLLPSIDAGRGLLLVYTEAGHQVEESVGFNESKE